MLRRLSYANVTATLALVFAMSGGALAANHYLINSTKQINPKVLKKLRGKTGASGRAGEKGGMGATGATGEKGGTGATGATGPRGETGVSALSTLPAGESESGQVAAVGSVAAGREIEDTVTFPVPLPETLAESHVIFTTAAGTTHCSGEGHADNGYLCIYLTNQGNVEEPLSRNFEDFAGGAGFHGLGVFWKASATSEAWAEGTWTVTAG